MATPITAHVSAQQIPIARTLRIRDCGLNEYWLQDQIYQNPSCLGLGELESLSKERPQSSGGRLDMLLKDDDDVMYEVEVMLGDTDESHIIRTIEYWDNEKRKWPQRQHFAVLVAESITRRFFNVIQLLSQSVPIIAIQANMIEANGAKILNFTKVLDVYEEPADVTEVDKPTTEIDWRERAPWTLETAKGLLEAVKSVLPNGELSFRQQFIGLKVNQNNYFWLNKRSSPKSRLGFRMDDEGMETVTTLLDEAGIAYAKQTKRILVTTDKAGVEAHADTLKKVGSVVRNYWEK